MAAEGKRSKGRFHYLFDWNAKSRKKLFSNKSESSEGSNQGKENVDNLVISQYLLREMRDNGDYPSFRGSGNFSSPSSVNGDDVYGARAPGVVARLMGLDTMPIATSGEASSISSYEFRAVNSSFHSRGTAPSRQDCRVMDCSYAPSKMDGVTWNSMDSRTNRANGRPFERFQTEVLPPKSAKPISITHHKLLSPIKSPGFVPSNDAAYIMEAAAKIIDQAPQSIGRAKISSLGSPSSSFRIHELRDRMDAAQRSFRLSDTPRTPKQSPSVQQVKENQSDRSSHRSLFKNIMGSQSSTSHKMKSKVKSASMPVQDQATTQKGGSLASSGRSRPHRERKKGKEKELSNAQMEPDTHKPRPSRASRKKTSSVLRQNNDKQNSVSHKDKSTSKSSVSIPHPRKTVLGDNAAGPSKIVNKVFVNAGNVSKKPVLTTIVPEKRTINGVDRRPSLNRMKNISRSKQHPTRNDRLAEHAPESSVVRDPSPQNDSRRDMDVISFTFTSPIKKSGSQPLKSAEVIGTSCHLSNVDSLDEGEFVTQSSLSPPLGLNLVDSGSLSRLLEQKLQELTDKIGSTKPDAMVEETGTESMSCLSESISSYGFAETTVVESDECSDRDQTSTNVDDDDDCSSSVVTRSSQKWEDFEGSEEHDTNCSIKEANHNSGIEPLNTEPPECSISGSWMSSTTSEFTNGYDQPSSPQSQEVISSLSAESILPIEDDTSAADVMSYWELEYVRYMLHYAELKGYRSVEDYNIIDPGVFDLLENLINTSGRSAEQCSKLERRIVFDCVSEIISSRYERAFVGSYKSWIKWCCLLQTEWLTEEVYKEIYCWQSMGNLMVDELVDWDMSTQYGRWLDFEMESLEEGIEIEVEIVSDLVDELVTDLLVQNLSRI